MSERAATEDALAVIRGAADDLDGGDNPEDVARWLRKRSREIQSRLDGAGDDAEVSDEEAIDELGGGAATAEIDGDDLFTDGGCDRSTEEGDRGRSSVAREHLLGATVWAYGGGGVSIKPWDSLGRLKMPARLER